MTAADGGKCNIQKQSRAKKAPRAANGSNLLCWRRKNSQQKCILMLHPRRTGQNSRRNASSFSPFRPRGARKSK
jgi:hypothetical protein